jgi:alkylhydroperoxidase family enzyme
MSREADAVRARVPDVARSYAETRATVLEGGAVDPAIKLLCARFLAGEAVEGETAPERAALVWAEAVEWDDRRADDALWAELHAHFSEPELVELGYFIAFTLGQMHWLRTLGIRPDPAAP